MSLVRRNLNTGTGAICIARERRELGNQPIDSSLTQQIIRVLQRQVFGNVFAPAEPRLPLRLQQCGCPRFIKFAHIWSAMVS